MVSLWGSCWGGVGCVVSQTNQDHIFVEAIRWLSLEEAALMELAR